RNVEIVTTGFDGPLAVVAAKGHHLTKPDSDGLKILVPVSGSGVWRRGAEGAVALARSSNHPLRVIYVTTTRDKGRRRRNVSVSLFEEEAILKETIALAARYDVEVVTTLRTNTAPEAAILQEMRGSNIDLVVMG